MLRALLARLAPARLSACGLLGRLRRDRAGNTLAIMAISMIPIAGMLGSALDLSRSYLVRTRLQQACDAGVLAARKAMTGNVIAQTDRTRAQEFFNANFRDGVLGATNTAFSIASGTPADIVAGTATTIMPMTLMKMFGYANVSLEVKCESRFDLTNTDVVFVLDVTGSMSCLTSDNQSTCDGYAGNAANMRTAGDQRYMLEKNNSRIDGLRAAVLDFFDTLNDAKTPGTRIRYSFVPYSTTVNVGGLLRALDSSYIRDTNTYESRRPEWWRRTSETTTTVGSLTACNNMATARSPSTGYPATQSFTLYNSTARSCRVRSYEYRDGLASASQPSGFSLRWIYEERTINNAQFKLGATVQDDTQWPRVGRTWAGCIEEVNTTQNWTSGTLPQDLNVDLVPSSDATRWRPQRPELIFDDSIYTYGATPEDANGGRMLVPSTVAGTGAVTGGGTFYTPIPNLDACPKAATRLEEMTRDEVDDYLSEAEGFRPYGNTYHDIGMVWGGRMLSTTGIFAADNTDATNTSRNIVFLTDGAMQPQEYAANAYGFERLDHRISSATNNLTARHNARFNAVCNNLPTNVNVWVVAFSQSLTTELTNCADAGRSFTVTNTGDLQTKFREIAGRIAGLRLNK